MFSDKLNLLLLEELTSSLANSERSKTKSGFVSWVAIF